MRKIIFTVIILFVVNGLFAISLKEVISRVPVTNLPFSRGKTVRCIKPNWGFTAEEAANLPLALYQDLGLTQKYNDPNVTCNLCRKFQVNKNFDLLALDIWVSEWSKQLLATYKNGELIDCIEADVSWYSEGALFVKQWRINTKQEIIVTWLKVESSTPIMFYSDFSSIQAQRVDTYYEIDSSGKFQEIKQVKYLPQIYTKAYLTDKNKNLWEGNESLME